MSLKSSPDTLECFLWVAKWLDRGTALHLDHKHVVLPTHDQIVLILQSRRLEDSSVVLCRFAEEPTEDLFDLSF